MLRTAILAVLARRRHVAAAANTETLAERSQEKARTVLDRAVEANGGAEALRAVEVVRLHARRRDISAAADDDARAAVRGRQLRRDPAGRPREKPPAPRAEGRRLRLRRRQHDRDRGRHRQQLRQPREDRHADPGGAGDPAAVHPVPPAAAEPDAAPGARPHELAALPRRGPVRGPQARSRDLRDAGHAAGRALRRCRDRASCRSTN